VSGESPAGSGVPDGAVLAVWSEARRLGFLGPGPVETHLTVSHALRAAVALPPARAVDLGSGGGVPGLVLARAWPESHWLFLDSNERRAAFLGEAVAHLGLVGRVEVVRIRAELAGRERRWRGAADLVVARGFGSPSATAECGAPLLRPGGRLLVTEPPVRAAGRWSSEGLWTLGLAETARSPVGVVGSWVAFTQVVPCPDQYPRRVGLPAKRPLFAAPA
jgi:16S rRNA (guanine527-N7)-methyltransferase